MLAVAGQHQGFGGEVDGRGEGDGRADPAQLLGDGAQLDAPQAQAAEFLRNGGPQPALFGDAFPKARVVAFGRVVQNAADHGRGAARFEEFARFIFQELLVVRVVEIHLKRLPTRDIFGLAGRILGFPRRERLTSRQ